LIFANFNYYLKLFVDYYDSFARSFIYKLLIYGDYEACWDIDRKGD
jgi:hypothetical protein